MASSREISTISYNSPGFLRDTLKRLCDIGWLAEYAYILHDRDSNPDTGELKKPHYHVYMRPAKALNPVDLKSRFIEPVSGSDIPLKCMAINPSRLDTWLLYCLHHPDYPKGHADGKTQYLLSDIFFSDGLDLETSLREAEIAHCASSVCSISSRISSGETPIDIAAGGVDPFRVKTVVDLMSAGSRRSGRPDARMSDMYARRYESLVQSCRDHGIPITWDGDMPVIDWPGFLIHLHDLPDASDPEFPFSVDSSSGS